MPWPLTFISEEDFRNHVIATIEKYGEKLESYDIRRFNSNIVDPIKLIPNRNCFLNLFLSNLKRGIDLRIHITPKELVRTDTIDCNINEKYPPM